MMKIAICEDNITEAEELKQKLSDMADNYGFCIDRPDIFTRGGELLGKNNIYDLIFIDCRLPDMTGPELAKRMRSNGVNSDIIFVTAYNEYAVEGYECGALRYLMKPVSDDKLSEALSAFIKKQNLDCRIDLNNPGEPMIVRQSDIIYIEAGDSMTLVRLNSTDIYSRSSLKDFEKLLRSPVFFRTSRQFIVNMQYIDDFFGDEIVLRNCSEHVKISRRNIKAFRLRYRQYLTSNYYTEDDEK